MIKHSQPTLNLGDCLTVGKVILSGNIAQGKKVRQFETMLAKYVGHKHAFAFNSGTSALHIALMVLGVEKGDEIIIPDFVCVALLNAIHQTGATAKIVDIDLDDYNISPEEIEKNINSNTKCIIVPHLFGCPAKIEKIMEIAKKHKIVVIEDCAQALGASYKGKKVGSFGDLSIYSFYATKVITSGEGGAITTNDGKLAAKINKYKTYDNNEEFMIRYNYKMTDMQAALGINQLKKIGSFIKKRRKIAKTYTQKFGNSKFQIPKGGENQKNIYYRYIIMLQNVPFQKFSGILHREGISITRAIYKPLHIYLNLNSKNFKNSCKAYSQCVSIPIYPSLKKGEMKKITKVISSLIET